MTWTNAKAADGPKTAEAVERLLRQRFGERKLPDSTARRLYEWRHGDKADFFTIDRVLSKYGYHVSELPDEIWVPGSPWAKRKVPPRPAKVIGSGNKQRRIPVEKNCAYCGMHMPYSGKRPDKYEAKDFCSRACSNRSRKA